MEIKKIIYNAFLFIAISVVMYVTIVFLLLKIKIGDIPLVYRSSEVINWKGGNSYRKFADFNVQGTFDVIVIGSSHAYRGYDPRIFKKNNIRMFNLGTSGQSLLNSYYIAKNYIKHSNCKLVILDIYDGALSSNGLESTADLIQNISSTKAAVEMGLALKDPRVISMLTVRMLTTANPPMYKDSSYVLNGYSEKKDSIKNTTKRTYTSKLEINKEQFFYLKNILEYFTSNDIKVIAITHPAPKETDKNNHLKFYKAVKSITDSYGVNYLDYSYTYSLSSHNDYYDNHHLNQSGVEKFNEILINDLNKIHPWK